MEGQPFVLQIIIWVVGQLMAAAAIWGGLKQGMANLTERVKRVEDTADKAHGRIDTHIQNHNDYARRSQRN